MKHAHCACSARQQTSSIKFPEAEEFVRWCDGVGTEGEENQPTAHRLHQGGSANGGTMAPTLLPAQRLASPKSMADLSKLTHVQTYLIIRTCWIGAISHGKVIVAKETFQWDHAGCNCFSVLLPPPPPPASPGEKGYRPRAVEIHAQYLAFLGQRAAAAIKCQAHVASTDPQLQKCPIFPVWAVWSTPQLQPKIMAWVLFSGHWRSIFICYMFIDQWKKNDWHNKRNGKT